VITVHARIKDIMTTRVVADQFTYPLVSPTG
jgi:hypothetical protein